MNGTWQTTGGGRGKFAVELFIAILAIGAAVGVAGAVETVTIAILPWILAVAGLFIAGIIGGALYALWRHARGRPLHIVPRPVIVRAPEPAALPKPERPALEQPRELHQHVHYHWHGADEDRAAGLLRRTTRPE